MKLNKPINENYAAIVVEITTLIPLAGCDNVQAAIIMGNQVVVGKDVRIGDIGLYFPVETALSRTYLITNNLYRKDLKLNSDPDNKGGFFELNGRIRCQKFRGHKSEGLYMPITSIEFTFNEKTSPMPTLNDSFDELNGTIICRKYYTPKPTQSIYGFKQKGAGKLLRKSKLIENQFRFHQNTSMLYKNLHKIQPNDLISITYKMHGTSGISSKILCKKSLNWFERLLKTLKINIIDTQYDYIYSSRKVIKNSELNPNSQHFYDTDIWGKAHEVVKEFLSDGMTFYYEIVGFLPSGGYIQGPYDYGQEPGKFEVRIYRITYTNPLGKVFEFSAHQVQDFCKEKGLFAVPELYYGTAHQFLIDYNNGYHKESFQTEFLEQIKFQYNEKDCYICKNEVPEEGCVIRIEKNDFEAYKVKSNAFYMLETTLLDQGVIDIEDEN